MADQAKPADVPPTPVAPMPPAAPPPTPAAHAAPSPTTPAPPPGPAPAPGIAPAGDPKKPENQKVKERPEHPLLKKSADLRPKMQELMDKQREEVKKMREELAHFREEVTAADPGPLTLSAIDGNFNEAEATLNKLDPGTQVAPS